MSYMSLNESQTATIKDSLQFLAEINSKLELLRQADISNEEFLSYIIRRNSEWGYIGRSEFIIKFMNDLQKRRYVDIYDKNGQQLYIGCELKSPDLFNPDTYDRFKLIVYDNELAYKNYEDGKIYDLKFLGHSDLILIVE